MSQDNQSFEEILFDLAVQKPTAEERAAFLEEVRRVNPALGAQLAELLEGHFGRAGFLPKHPAGAALSATLPAGPSEESPTQMIGRYKLLEKIGEGGFGEVWMAEQREPVKRRVALKIIKLGMDSRQIVARFEAERQALAMMDHANIARIYDAGTTDTGRPYFVMELVRGIKITEYCDQNQLPTEERLKLFIQVCQAIQHAHQKGIIHRDLKPSNILVTLHDGVPVPKVIDFGIAKATQQELTDKTVFTQFQQFIGTPAYISPEQAEMSGLDIDTRADIYSLGVLLYELLVGQTPFDANEMMKGGLDALRQIIREREPLRPSTKLNTLAGEARTTAGKRRQTEVGKLVHQLQGDLDWIVMKCLEKDRTRRYDTANGLAMDIQRHLNCEPVLARPPSTLYEFQKTVRRHKFGFAATAAIIVVLAAGITLTTWQAIVATRATKAESQQRLAAQTAQVLAQSKQQEAETERQRADAQAQNASQSQQQSRRLLYDADMNLAQQSLKLNNLGRARRLLDRHRPHSGEEDLRGWEWRYLWQLTRSSALVTLTNRPVKGWSVSFSPDGSRLAVGWTGGNVDLWDVPGRRLVRSLTDVPSGYAARVAFSPVRNLLAAASGPETVVLYDLDSDRKSILWQAPKQDRGLIVGLAFSQDGSRLVIDASSPQDGGDVVWVVNVSSTNIESRHSTLVASGSEHHGAAQVSPDNQRLYLARNDASKSLYSIQCIDLASDKEIWQTARERDYGLTTLAISPDGHVLASGSGFEDPTIRVWDAATGRLLVRLEGHTGWVCKLAFSRDGRRLISAASDQSIRFWDTSNWTETQVLRGHTDEVHAVAISDSAQMVASASKDGDLMLWKDDGKSATDGYSRFPENLMLDQVLPLDHSRFVLLPPAKPPEVVDFKRDSVPRLVPEFRSSTNVLGWFGTNILCLWNGTNQILVREWRGAEFISLGAIALDSGTRPAGLAYNATRQLLAWTEGTSSASVYLTHLATPARRIEMRSDIHGLVPLEFSEDGSYLAAATERGHSLRAWNVETGQIVASVEGPVLCEAFAAAGRVLVVTVQRGDDHEVQFYDLAHPDRAPRRIPGRDYSRSLSVSPDGGLVASSTYGGLVRLFDPAKGELIESIHGHLNAVFGTDFSPDGRRLISTMGAREAVKLWDVGTRQELLTLPGAGSFIVQAQWSADGDVIFVGWPGPWQAWRAPSWEEIAAAEAKAENGEQAAVNTSGFRTAQVAAWPKRCV